MPVVVEAIGAGNAIGPGAGLSPTLLAGGGGRGLGTGGATGDPGPCAITDVPPLSILTQNKFSLS